MKILRNRMWLFFAVLVFSSVLTGSILAEDGKLIRESWLRSTMASDEIGWTHEEVFELSKEGKTLYKTQTEAVMEMKRFGQGVSISIKGWALEDAEGHVLEMHQESNMSSQVTLYHLVVNGDKAQVTITTMDTPRESSIDWDANALGPMGVWMLRREKGYTPGISYEYKSFLFEYMQMGTMSIEHEDYEETDMLDNEKQKLFRSAVSIDLLPGIKTTEWMGDDYVTYKTWLEMMGISIGAYRTSKERATREGAGELKSDMLIETMATANVNIPVPYKLDSILYRFKAKDPELGLPKELERLNQKVIERDEQEALIRISAVVPESAQAFPMNNPPPELMEYLEPNAYVQCDHLPLQEKALELVADAKDAWQAACILENFVFTYIKDKNFGTGFASAAEVFENPTGDCSEHGVLLCAMCRAVGIPTRVALGYMYLGGIFGGHMWAEVWINGEWYPIDGVMGIGRVDPTHITFSDGSLADGGLTSAFASAVAGLGNIDLKIIELVRGDQVVKIGEEGFKDYTIEGNTFTNTLYGISISKPEGYTFSDYIKNYSGPDFKLLEIKGDSKARLEALPAVFSFSFDDFKGQLEARGLTIDHVRNREVGGQPARVYLCSEDGSDDDQVRIMAVIYQDTCYFLAMEINNGKADVATFKSLVDSIRFTN